MKKVFEMIGRFLILIAAMVFAVSLGTAGDTLLAWHEDHQWLCTVLRIYTYAGVFIVIACGVLACIVGED